MVISLRTGERAPAVDVITLYGDDDDNDGDDDDDDFDDDHSYR